MKEFIITGILQHQPLLITGYGMWLQKQIRDIKSDTVRYLMKMSKLNSNIFHRNDSLLKPWKGRKDLRKLIRFSKGYYTAGISDHGIVFNDLRFGQMMGWENKMLLLFFTII